jgi:iron complex transport system substrate-binding protein
MQACRAVVAAVFLLFLDAPAGAAERPERIVSFNLCADQLAVALADPDQIVGLSPYAADPAVSTVADKARAFHRVGWQAELMVSLAPDLVLVGTWDRPLTQRMLRALNFRVVPVDLVSDIESGLAQIRAMATLLGHPERGEALLAGVDAARQRLAAAPRPEKSSALLIGNAGYTVGPASLAAALMAEAGLVPPPGAPTGYGGYVPLERLIALRPDYLVLSSLIETPDSQGAVYLTHPALRELYPPARRIILPARYTLCGGPSLIAAFDYLTGIIAGLAAR